MDKQFDVFISYSRLDSDIAFKLCDALDRARISYFIDRRGLSGGFEFPEIIANAIVNCKLFLFLGSKNSYNSKFTNSEITFAFNKKDKNKILPYIIDDYPLPLSLEFVFSAINWRKMKENPIEPNLVKDLCEMLGKPISTPNPNPITPPTSVSKATSPRISVDATQMTTFNRLKAKAESGDAAAQYELACKYYFGKDVELNYRNAFRWFSKSAKHGNAQAQYRLGVCYQYGKGVKADINEAIIAYESAANQGNADAMYKLGYCYQYGKGVYPDSKISEKFYREAAKLGNEAAKAYVDKRIEELKKVDSFIQSKNFESLNPITQTKIKAYRGDVDAQIKLGDMYYKGSDVERDYNEAVKWYKEAAEDGNADAMYKLGNLYFNDKIQSAAKDEFMFWYKKAAENGHIKAQFKLGYCYRYGKGVQPNLTLAKKWLKLAADRGHEVAKEYLILSQSVD
jgi:hypothetical protein